MLPDLSPQVHARHLLLLLLLLRISITQHGSSAREAEKKTNNDESCYAYSDHCLARHVLLTAQDFTEARADGTQESKPGGARKGRQSLEEDLPTPGSAGSSTQMLPGFGLQGPGKAARAVKEQPRESETEAR